VPAISAFLVTGSPLPLLRPDNPPWRALREAFGVAAQALSDSRPDVLLVYSTRWIAVLDALWQTRPLLTGVHVDEVWHEYGDLPYDIRIDVDLAAACVAATNAAGIRAKGVDFDAFPVDTATVVANTLLNGGAEPRPLVLTANNIYHDADTTERLGAIAMGLAEKQGKTAAVIAIGGLSRQFFDRDVEPAQDAISDPEHDELNRRLLDLLAAGDIEAVRTFLPDFSLRARADHHMKHLSWLLGATGGFAGATVHAYGPDYGGGAAVVEFAPVHASRRRPLDGTAARSRPGPQVWRPPSPQRERGASRVQARRAP
jgi:2-aminophenol/2-amino-5-chlorophenol 1,6-dioxygenase alpha subunit